MIMGNTGKISVFIVDDHKIFREGFKLLISRFQEFELVGEASNGIDFLEQMKTITPDIIFMDISMPGLNGLEATKIALERNGNLKIIVLTTFLEEDYVEQMIMAGVEGYMLKNSEIDDFDKAIKRVYHGGNYFSEEIVAILLGNLGQIKRKKEMLQHMEDFTPREIELLKLICKGLNNEQIAEAAFVSIKTVEKYKSSLFQKTNTQNTVNLVIYAFKNHLVDF